MSIYGPGLSFEEECNLDKDRLKHALLSPPEIMTGEDENGFIYQPCTREDAEKEVLSIFDGLVYQALEPMHTARALEKIAMARGFRAKGIASMQEYNLAMKETALPEKYEYKSSMEERLEDVVYILGKLMPDEN